MTYPTLIFDLDGTLPDSGLGILRCAQYALDHFNIHVADLNALRPFVGPPLEDSFIEFYGFTPAQADEAVRIYRERYFTTGVYENEVYPGTREALAELKRRGYRIGIGSSKNEPMVREVLRYFDLGLFFDFVTARDEAGVRHTKADVLRHALQLEGIDDPQKALMIGDRFYDIEGAHEVGMPAVGILWGGYATRQEMVDCEAEYIVDTWDELLDLLKE
jgi:phosphoglycolate phosphatase